MRRTIPLLVGLLLGCASTSSMTPSDLIQGSDAPLLAVEIGHTKAFTAFEAVQQLRPAYLEVIPLRTRGQVAPPPTAVFVNGSRVGGLEVLHAIPAAHVSSIRLVKPLHTVTTLGQGFGGGAILVELRH